MKLRAWFTFLILSAAAIAAAELQPPARTEPFARNLEGEPVPRFQAGRVFSKDASLGSFWIEQAGGDSPVQATLSLPGAYRIAIRDVAVSFDGKLAVCASAMDREGRFVPVIVWAEADGTVSRVVRTAPFGAMHIGFTANGSLWAAGVVKKNTRDEEEVYDVLRQYDADGRFVRSLLPRLSVSTGVLPPTTRSFFSTSRNSVAFVSLTARKWFVVSAEGGVLAQGPLNAQGAYRVLTGGQQDGMSPGLEITRLAVTDSHRTFVTGQWRQGTPPPGFSRFPLFEIDPTTGALKPVDTASVLPSGTFGMLLGSDGEYLVFHVTANLATAGVKPAPMLYWATVK